MEVIKAILVLIIGLGVLYAIVRIIKKNDAMFKLMREHACSISAIRLPEEWISKRDELNGLMYDKYFMLHLGIS